tara:strand:- start:663 stop:881 length:219 start_codon:yes stop_codon:yes gene_type:complete
MDKKYVKEKRLKNTLTSEISSKLISANEKEPLPKPSAIFESYPNKKINRKKEIKKDYKNNVSKKNKKVKKIK